MNFTILGGFIGFTIFVIMLESKSMGAVLYRDGRYRIGGLFKYLKAPLNQTFLWYPQCWFHNWILMIIMGSISGFVLGYGLEYGYVSGSI
jgi:hypothetical protein